MKLELKHLAPYLSYDIRVEVKCDEEVYKSTLVGFGYFDKELHALCGNKIHNGLYHINGEEYIKPILRPISDLTKEIEHNGKKFVPSSDFENLYLNDCKWGHNSIGTGIIGKNGFMAHLCFMHNEIIGECPLAIYELLIEWHFDVFGLIEKGLAIDINNLNNEKTNNIL